MIALDAVKTPRQRPKKCDLNRFFEMICVVFAQAFVLTGFGCQGVSTGQVDFAQVNNRPSWVDHLHESIDTIPAIEAPREMNLATPTRRSESKGQQPRGMPKDLTARINSPANPSALLPKPRPITEANGHTNPTPIVSPVVKPLEISKELDHSQPPPLPEVSQLEKLYKGSFSPKADRVLEQFGYDYFKQASSSVDHSGPVPEDYPIGPDDEVVVTVTGSFQLRHRSIVDRDGMLTLPDIGPIPVAGRPFRELHGVIHSAIGKIKKEFEVTVSLGRLRRINIHLVGHVTRPGLTEVPARSTVLTALAAVGGPSKSGSLRQIRLRRENHPERKIDLYDFLIGGMPSGHDLLQSGDIVFVPPIGSTVGVAGYVQRPGIYEINRDVVIDQMITMAGGLTPFSFTSHIRLERTIGGRGRETLDIPLDDEGLKSSVQAGDLLLVEAIDHRMQPVVQVVGQVIRPGNYQYRAGIKVSDVLRQADGLTIDAYLPQAFISRQVGLAGRVEVVPGRQSMGSSRRILVVDLAKAMQGDPTHDIELMPLDQIAIQSLHEATVRPTVSVLGAVQRPGTYELTSGIRVSSLISIAGNILPEVYYDEAELIRRVYDEEKKQLDIRRFRFDLGRALRGDEDPVLENGDQLVIRSLRAAHVTVTIDGEVRFPGRYVFPAGAHITDLIAAAGGVLEHADLRAAFFTRRSVKELQKQRFEHLAERTRRLYEASLEKMVQSGRSREGLAAKLALVQTQELLARMNGRQSNGRVIIPFTREDFLASLFNLTLEDGDRLFLPRRQETIAIVGHVFNPSSFVAESGVTVQQVLDRVGGITEHGDSNLLYVIRADGNVENVAQKKKSLAASTLLPGDVVLVPREPMRRTFGAKAADAIAMVRQLAEVALITSHLGDGTGDLGFTTVGQPPAADSFPGYEDVILKSKR